MAMAEKVKQYLESRHVIYDVRELPPFASLLEAAEVGGIPPGAIAKSVVLNDELGTVLVVVPATHAVEADALGRLLHRRFDLPDEARIKQVFPDCQPRFIPPVGEAYGIRTIVDEALMGLTEVYFPVGDFTRLLRVSGKDFFNLLSGAWLAGDFARPIIAASGGAGYEERETDLDIKRRVQRLSELPAIPQLALKIIELRDDPHADAHKLTKLVELDPALAAQVIRYARSPFFAYRGTVDSIHTAISRVLGFEMVMNLALGIATARAFRIPAIGPLGLNAFWRHATHSAALVQALGAELPSGRRPLPGLSYLAGLLHNIGFLLLGHLFKREFCLLNTAVADHPDIPVREQEQAQLGTDHTELGAWLLEKWNLPAEIVTAVRHHHDEDYQGPHEAYARLVLLADRMLKGLDMGDAASAELPLPLLESLGLKELQTVMVMGRILQGVEGLNVMARGLAAA
jgi:HD-like signal output (HDOD) protein/prolyl-tRNA editing enzyme YbaK/EbsC (Cys-tRNA(Pro) deacylase)